jgi:hypothetical protein
MSKNASFSTPWLTPQSTISSDQNKHGTTDHITPSGLQSRLARAANSILVYLFFEGTAFSQTETYSGAFGFNRFLAL